MPVKTIQPIHKRQISKATIDRLLSMIKDGYWAPGEKLPPQRELAESLSIGMSTLREALQSLQTMGILEVRHGDGTYVSDRVNDRFENSLSMSLAMGELDLQMLFEARGILEPGFAYFAANRATKEQVEKLFEILEDELANAVVQNALAVNDLVLFGVKSGCVILEVLDERTGLRALVEDFGLAFVNAPSAIHGD